MCRSVITQPAIPLSASPGPYLLFLQGSLWSYTLIPRVLVQQEMLNMPVFFFLPFFEALSQNVLVAQSCPTLCNPMDCSPPGSSVRGIFEARILSSLFISAQISEYLKYLKVLVTQLCPTLCNSMDCSLSDSSVHGIFQARILEWVAISSFRGSSRPRDQTHISRVSCIGR